MYIHVPFCASACPYCDFFSVPDEPGAAGRFAAAAGKELRAFFDATPGPRRPLDTVYVGGGTPSILPPTLWHDLARSIRDVAGLAAGAEWSIECNPESYSDEKARAWRETGVTRLSIGVQSLDDRELSACGRCHDAARARGVLANGALRQFDSIGVDIIYGLPGQTLESLERSLRGVLDYPVVSHLSAYELTLHEGTPFWATRATLSLPSEDTLGEMTERVGRVCSEYGLEQYEVSNFARPGHECRHNAAYWTHKPYLGVGPSAHSYLPPQRTANVSSVDEYLAAIESGRSACDRSETLGPAETGREMIFLGLRTRTGIDETEFRRVAGEDLASAGRRPVLEELLAAGLVEHAGTRWAPTNRGMLVADGIARRLM